MVKSGAIPPSWLFGCVLCAGRNCILVHSSSSACHRTPHWQTNSKRINVDLVSRHWCLYACHVGGGVHHRHLPSIVTVFIEHADKDTCVDLYILVPYMVLGFLSAVCMVCVCTHYPYRCVFSHSHVQTTLRLSRLAGDQQPIRFRGEWAQQWWGLLTRLSRHRPRRR